jgi:hypothetical protein
MRLPTICLVFGWLLSAGSSYANLGDNYATSVKRYGQPWSNDGNAKYTFHYGGWIVTEYFNASGRCDIICYAHQRDFSSGQVAELTDSEINNWLTFNAPRGNSWAEFPSSMGRQWALQGKDAQQIRLLALFSVAPYIFRDPSGPLTLDIQQLQIGSERGLARWGVLLPPPSVERPQPSNGTDFTKI